MFPSAGRLPSELAETLSQTLRVDRCAERGRKDKIVFLISVSGKVTLELLNVAVIAQNAHRLGIQRDRAS